MHTSASGGGVFGATSVVRVPRAAARVTSTHAPFDEVAYAFDMVPSTSKESCTASPGIENVIALLSASVAPFPVIVTRDGRFVGVNPSGVVPSALWSETVYTPSRQLIACSAIVA